MELLRNKTKAKEIRVIISDLKMSMVDGFDFLRWSKSKPHLSKVPFYVLTSSDETSDRRRCEILGVSGYFVKPNRFEKLVEIAESFRQIVDGD